MMPSFDHLLNSGVFFFFYIFPLSFSVTFKCDMREVVIKHAAGDCPHHRAVHQMMFTFWHYWTVISVAADVSYPAMDGCVSAAYVVMYIQRELYLTFALVWRQVHFIDNLESTSAGLTQSKQLSVLVFCCVCTCTASENLKVASSL